MSSPACNNCVQAHSQLAHAHSYQQPCHTVHVAYSLLLLLQWPCWAGSNPHVVGIESQPVSLQAEVQPRQGEYDQHLLDTLTRHCGLSSLQTCVRAVCYDATVCPNPHMLNLLNNASLCVSKSCLFSALTILAQLAFYLVSVSQEFEFFS